MCLGTPELIKTVGKQQPENPRRELMLMNPERYLRNQIKLHIKHLPEYPVKIDKLFCTAATTESNSNHSAQN